MGYYFTPLKGPILAQSHDQNTRRDDAAGEITPDAGAFFKDHDGDHQRKQNGAAATNQAAPPVAPDMLRDGADPALEKGKTEQQHRRQKRHPQRIGDGVAGKSCA